MTSVVSDWYRSFVAVYRAGTVTAAAAARGLTQPAVSQHLAALEAAAGAPLFGRTARRMVPTARGHDLYAQVAPAVDALERASARLVGSSDEPPLVRLGGPAEWLSEVGVAAFVGAPFRWQVRLGQTPALLAELARGELDLVVATQRLAGRGIEFAGLAEERFVLVGATGTVAQPGPQGISSPNAIGTVVARLAAQPWVAYGPELPIIRRFWQQSFGRRPEIRPVLVVPDLRAVAGAVERGVGLSVLPEYLCRTALATDRLRVVWEPPTPVSNDLWLAFRRSDRGDRTNREARNRLGDAVFVAMGEGA